MNAILDIERFCCADNVSKASRIFGVITTDTRAVFSAIFENPHLAVLWRIIPCYCKSCQVMLSLRNQSRGWVFPAGFAYVVRRVVDVVVCSRCIEINQLPRNSMFYLLLFTFVVM